VAADSTERNVDVFGQTKEAGTLPPRSETDTAESMVGKRIGSYVVQRKLGQGGMGVVYEAAHESIGQRTAIKVLHSRLSQDTKISERFLNEARAASIVRHPGMVKVYDHLQLPDGTLCMIMELLEGESLESCLKRMRSRGERMPPERAAEIVRQAASALQAAHQAGIVHCDLKPDNIFLVPDPALPGGERVKLLDFGIAKFLSGAVAQTTTTDVIMGTPRYMSPEQCLGREGVDSKVDVYSLGVIFYELLAGQRPFDAQNPHALMRQHLNMPPPPLADRAPGVDAELCRLVHTMLAKEGSARPSMAMVLELLGSPAQRSGRRRLRRKETLIFAVLLALLGGGGFWLWRRVAPARVPESSAAALAPPATLPPAAPQKTTASQPSGVGTPASGLPQAAPAPSPSAVPAASASAAPPAPASAPPPAAGKHRGHRSPAKRDEPSQTAPASGVLKSIDFGKR